MKGCMDEEFYKNTTSGRIPRKKGMRMSPTYLQQRDVS